MTAPQLALTSINDLEVWRVGYLPTPWDWVDWVHAGQDGRFGNRWDDPSGTFRVVYAASTLRGALLEILAQFRPDPLCVEGLDEIEDDDPGHPTVPAGTIQRSWVDKIGYSSALLTGTFCRITHSSSVAALRPHFLQAARDEGFDDFDAALLRNVLSRTITQRVSAHLRWHYGDLTGIAYQSRHGDEEELWAVWEQASDGRHSAALSQISSPRRLDDDDDDIRAVLKFLNLVLE